MFRLQHRVTPADVAGVPPREMLHGALLAEGRGDSGREGSGGRETVHTRQCEEYGDAEARDPGGVGQGHIGGGVPYSGKGHWIVLFAGRNSLTQPLVLDETEAGPMVAARASLSSSSFIPVMAG